MNFWRKLQLFSLQAAEVRKEERIKFIVLKTDDGKAKGKINFYCRSLEVSRQAFYDYLERKNSPWKYEALADEIMKIHNEDKHNDCYGRNRMYIALKEKEKAGEIDVHVPSESTVRKIMDQIGLIHKPNPTVKHASQMTF